MENASKALLMAAGVLIGLIILSLAAYLGITFSSHTKVVAEEYELQKIQQFNNRFTKYEDKDITIYDAVSIANVAKEVNEGIQSGSNRVKVYLGQVRLDEEPANDLMQRIKNQNEELTKYTVECTMSQETGYVISVRITEK